MALTHASPAMPLALLDRGGTATGEKSSALVKTDAFEAIHLVIAAGRTIPSHRVEGPITLYCLEGKVQLCLEASKVELAAGEWLFLEGGQAHSVEGMQNSRLLLTIISPRKR